MTTTRLYGPCWTKRDNPTLIGRTTQSASRSTTDTGTVKPEPRESFAACKTDGGRRKPKKCSSAPTPTIPRCCTALSRPSMVHPEVEQPLPPPPSPLTNVHRWHNHHQRQRRNQSRMGGALQPTLKPTIYCRPRNIAVNTSEASIRRP